MQAQGSIQPAAVMKWIGDHITQIASDERGLTDGAGTVARYSSPHSLD